MQKCDKTQGVDWSYYSKFDSLNEKYLPDCGEGETMATQMCTAINKLVYKWYNDGDVYDNTLGLAGWLNDLSSYANWLYKYIPQSQKILDRIDDANEDQYEDLLKDLTDTLLNQKTMEYYSSQEKLGSIYTCDGKFRFVEAFYDEEDDDESNYESNHENDDEHEDNGDEEM